MPMAVENLTEDSSEQAIRDAISSSFETCTKEGGRTPKECGGMIYGIAREKTGKQLAQ